MTEEDLKQFLEDNKAEIQAQVRQKMIDSLLAEHRWQIGGQISEIVNEFVKTEIAPAVKEHLMSEKSAILDAAIKSASGIGDLLAQALVERAAKNITGDSYSFRNTLKAIFE
ncbi:hypothetical protein N5K21_29220 [Rhizobium pusense]|uniref:hypothetical protein n=1 Tax=Agrobacterium pusense TaxID=648995 RepID=UPI00244D275D|nr:hypothetical protein [Agrobacterium pusense]MDH2092773.1 hypothetical protein [Agrobacterium pusense]